MKLVEDFKWLNQFAHEKNLHCYINILSSIHFVEFRLFSSQLIFEILDFSHLHARKSHNVLCTSYIAYGHNSNARYAQKMKRMKRKLTHSWKHILLECRISQSSKNLLEKLLVFLIHFKNIFLGFCSRSRYACVRQCFSLLLFIHFMGCVSAFINWFVRFVIRFHLINIIIQRSIYFVTLSLQNNLAKNGTTQKNPLSLCVYIYM